MTASVPDAPTDTPAADRVAEALSLPHPVKPKLRGWLHAGMFPAVLVSGLVLTALADSTRARIACGIFALTACLLFGVSAIYHRGNWSPRMDGVLRRLDHANIFLIIAGTYTPLTMLLLPERQGAVAAVGHLGRGDRGHRLPRLLGRRPALALHPVLHRDGLGGRLLPARLHADRRHRRAGPRDRGRPPLQRGRRDLRHSSAPTRHRAGSASTRSSTPSRSRRSSRTTSASRWWPTSTDSHPGPLRRKGPTAAAAVGPFRAPGARRVPHGQPLPWY